MDPIRKNFVKFVNKIAIKYKIPKVGTQVHFYNSEDPKLIRNKVGTLWTTMIPSCIHVTKEPEPDRLRDSIRNRRACWNDGVRRICSDRLRGSTDPFRWPSPRWRAATRPSNFVSKISKFRIGPRLSYLWQRISRPISWSAENEWIW